MNSPHPMRWGRMVALCLAATPVLAPAQPILRTPAGEWSWRGLLEADAATASQGGPILYPAPNLLGFFAAVLTHGALSQGMRSAEAKRLQDDADKVLEPYRAAAATLTPRLLLEEAAARLGPRARAVEAASPPDAVPAADEVHMVGNFALTQDERALVLDNVLRLPGPDGKPAEWVVRVFSSRQPVAEADTTPSPATAASAAAAGAQAASAPAISASSASGSSADAPAPGSSASDASAGPAPAAAASAAVSDVKTLPPAPAHRAHWLADGARALRAEAAAMVAHSIMVAQRAAAAAAAAELPYRTLRYRIGSRERIERAQLLASGCGRRVMRTLRGELLSVPFESETPRVCTDPYRVDP
jgi:hypothetical protein